MAKKKRQSVLEAPKAEEAVVEAPVLDAAPVVAEVPDGVPDAVPSEPLGLSDITVKPGTLRVVGYDPETNRIYAEANKQRVDIGVGAILYALSRWAAKHSGVPLLRCVHTDGPDGERIKLQVPNSAPEDALKNAMNSLGRALGYDGNLGELESILSEVEFSTAKTAK